MLVNLTYSPLFQVIEHVRRVFLAIVAANFKFLLATMGMMFGAFVFAFLDFLLDICERKAWKFLENKDNVY